MKITINLPKSLLQKAQAIAATQGESLEAFIVQALASHVADVNTSRHDEMQPAWMKCYGGLAHISDEVRRMQNEIDATFGKVDNDDWK